LEVSHGIHNHWKKTPEEPHFWGYTYNERFVDQLPFVFQRIRADWNEKGRITGRDYQVSIWRPGEDIILEQEDPPCFQRGHLRFLIDENGNHVLNFITDWRSRDLLKAWNPNVLGMTGPVGLHPLLAAKISDMLGIPVGVGAYIDRSSSLHLYGLYVDRDGLDKQIETMKSRGFEALSVSLDDFVAGQTERDITHMKRLIAAQADAEAKKHGKQQSEDRLIDLGYEVPNFEYPAEWDTWPASWDAEPDPDKLARVMNDKDVLERAALLLGRPEDELWNQFTCRGTGWGGDKENIMG
jgi:thymidylate synthase